MSSDFQKEVPAFPNRAFLLLITEMITFFFQPNLGESTNLLSHGRIVSDSLLSVDVQRVKIEPKDDVLCITAMWII